MQTVKPQYTLLTGEAYVALATLMTSINLRERKLRALFAQTSNDLDVARRRLNMYGANVFCKQYNCEKHSVVFTYAGYAGVSIYKDADVLNAVSMARERAGIDEEDDELADIVTDFADFLPKPVYTSTCTDTQIEMFRDLAEKYNALNHRYLTIVAKLQENNERYSSVSEEMVDQVMHDHRYNFNVKMHKVIVIPDEVAGHPQVLFCEKDQADNLLSQRGRRRQRALETITKQLHAASA